LDSLDSIYSGSTLGHNDLPDHFHLQNSFPFKNVAGYVPFLKSIELFASRLKKTFTGNLITLYRKSQAEFIPCFDHENGIVYCSNVEDLKSLKKLFDAQNPSAESTS